MKISKSKRKNKEYKVKVGNKVIHFADPNMPEFPGTKRGNNYCARSFGIKNKKGEYTRNDKLSANYWSRQLWSCEGKKSISKKRFFGM